MKNIVLPLMERPLITCYQHHAYPLGILLTDTNSIKWFYSNYIQLTYKPNDPCFFDFYHTYFYNWVFFERQSILKETLTINNVLVNDFIINAIKLGNYIYADIDEFYIPNRLAYNKFHNLHNVLIYGYDEGKKMYNIIGYTDRREYEPTLVGIDQFEKANPDIINIIKIRSSNKYYVDLKLIADLLKDYLFPQKIGGKYNMSQLPIHDDLFGIDACRWLTTFLENIRLGTQELDIRPFGVLLEHKVCMLNRLNYLNDNEIVKFHLSFIKEYEDIKNETLILRNLFFKLLLNGNMNLINNLEDRLDRIITREEKVLIYVLEEIETQIH